MNGVVFGVCLTSAISVPLTVSTQGDAGEERVTAKSKPMMNLVSRCRVRDPTMLASTASGSLVKTRSESQIPLSSWNEQQTSTERPVLGASSSGLWQRHRIGPFSKITFILEKSDRPIAKDVEPFSRRFNARYWQTFYDFGMFMSSTLEASVFMGKNYSVNLRSVKNTGKISL